VGIADGFGVAEDPNGLDWTELLRLVELSLPVTSFDKTKQGPETVLMTVETEVSVEKIKDVIGGI
jgi:hypothetical protein